MHAASMCNMKFIEYESQSKLEDLDEDIKKHSEDLKTYLEQLKETFLKDSVKNTVELYKKEITSFYASQVKPDVLTSIETNVIKPTLSSSTQKAEIKKIPIQHLFMPYQCLLGVVEVLMEYNFFSNNFTYYKSC